MPELLIPFTNFAIALVIIILVFLLVHLISKVTTFMTTLTFFFFICSLLLLAVSYEVGVNYLDFYPSMGLTIDSVILLIISPFMLIYELFFTGIISLCSLFMDVSLMEDFLLNDVNTIFVIVYQAIIFLLSLLIFKKEEPKKIDNSIYKE